MLMPMGRFVALLFAPAWIATARALTVNSTGKSSDVDCNSASKNGTTGSPPDEVGNAVKEEDVCGYLVTNPMWQGRLSWNEGSS